MASIKKYVTARLPDEYQEVEYLESTARSGFGIDTEYVPTQDTTTIVRAVKEGWSLFGSGANNYTFTGGGANNRHYGYLGNANSNYIPGDTWHTEFHDWKVEGRRFWCDDTPADTNYVGGNVPTVSLYLFCRNNNGINDGGLFKIAWCKIIENDVLMRYLIPCYRKSDGIRGFYDLAAGENDKKFYTNIGSGTFAKGADVNSSGWQPTGKLWTTKSEDLTLPATIYCNGSNITTYTIKGNTVQYGTPTPDSPIMPQGCGDLETVGAKAGQYKIPISSASTITPIYLGEVQTTRRIKKLVLTREENYDYQPQYSRYVFTVSSALARGLRNTPCFCTHYQSIYNGESIDNIPNNTIYINWQATGAQFCIKDEAIATLADFKSFLAAQYANGTPVTIWYVLGNPKTAVVNEPLQKIGDYADSIASSQAGVSIPTVAGENTISVDTTVQPSEFTATWTGWHELIGKVFDGTDWI